MNVAVGFEHDCDIIISSYASHGCIAYNVQVRLITWNLFEGVLIYVQQEPLIYILIAPKDSNCCLV